MRLSALLLLPLLFASCLFADRFNVGGTELTIPAPEGYIRVTDKMPQMQQFFAAIEDPENDTLAVYITPEAAELALAGELPSLGRYFMTKVSKRVLKAIVSIAEFKEARATLVAQQEAGIEEVRKRLPDLMERIDKNLSDAFGMDTSTEITQMVPLGVCMNEPDALAFSLLMSFGGENSFDMMATATILNVSGKVISLYAYGQAEDLEWTQERSAAWTEAILANNPPAPAKSSDSSFHWRRILTTCLSAIVISGAMGLLKRRQRLKRI